MAEKLKMASPDITDENIEFIRKKWPEAVTEVEENGKTVFRVDFDVLRQELSRDLISDKQERYQMTWPDKRKSIIESNSSISETLRPNIEKSKNFETTKNIYIEGDNLIALKILRETYLGKVKMIYIDPPYNTGNDFVYNDSFDESLDQYGAISGQTDENGNRLFQNTETNGRFHTDWLNMIYPRLRLAKDFLSDDGVIFINIDDKEEANLKKICDEIFSEHNFVGNIIWQSRTSISNDYEVSLNHNHTLIYSKIREKLIFGGDEIDPSEYINPDNDKRGPWKLVPLDANHAGGATIYPVKNPMTNVDYYPPNGRIWCYNKETMDKLIADGRIKFGLNDDSAPKRKLYYNERMENHDKKTPSSILLDAGTTKDGTNEIMSLFGGKKVFDYPKPVKLIKRLIQYGAPLGGIVMDFFSGSGTTAQAVFEYSKEKNVLVHFILVQLPENLDVTLKTAAPEARKTISNAISVLDSLNRPHKLTEIAEERISRVSDVLSKQSDIFSSNADYGFRVFSVDSSNMKDVYYNPQKTAQMKLDDDIDNVKPDRTHLDLLFQVMLNLGVDLSAKIEEFEFDDKKVYSVQDNYIVACFASDVSIEVISKVAQMKPVYAVFKDSSFQNDSANINCFQILKTANPAFQEENLKVI